MWNKKDSHSGQNNSSYIERLLFISIAGLKGWQTEHHSRPRATTQAK